MRIARVQAFAIRIPRDHVAVVGTAGSPAPLREDSGRRYQRAATYGTVYATALETTVVRVETTNGIAGWGEAQAPVVPEAAAAIVNLLLAPMLEGEDARDISRLWDLMYDAMRVRGHHGGFYLDAMAGVDLALWDIAGQAAGQSVSRLLASSGRPSVPVYVSGLRGATPDEKVAYASDLVDRGARAFKLFLDADEAVLLDTIDALRSGVPPGIELFVDALWRLDCPAAARLAVALSHRGVSWLEAPLAPEDIAAHASLVSRVPMPIALGECLRTTFEVRPWLDAHAVSILQPDLGRTGITGAMRIAAMAAAADVPLAPHVSVGLGPQIAAAAHFSAACGGVQILECNPLVYETANQFLRVPLTFDPASVTLPTAPGLGVDVDIEALTPYRL
jgi:D-galactarolactone cycloisomerase